MSRFTGPIRIVAKDNSSGALNSLVFQSGTRAAANSADLLAEQVISVTLTAAQIIAMYTTPVVVIPAVTGQIAIVDKIDMIVNAGATPFTGGGVLGLQYGSTAHLAGTAATGTIAAASVTASTSNLSTAVGASLANASSLTNTAISVSNQTAVFAAGNGTITLLIRYSTITATV